jgi:predicted RNA binding protein YcfA (HicA-like mRNA interferase family)
MSIDTPACARAALLRDGFQRTRQKGGHRRCRHPDGRRATLAFHHASDTLPLPALSTLVEQQARWTGQDLVRLGLLT